MENDILLEKFFNPQNWEETIELSIQKDMDKAVLRKLCEPETRLKLYNSIKSGNFEFAPSHQAQIPKDDGTMRTVYVCETADRVILSIINNLFFEMFPEMIHQNCRSYRKHDGCGKIVKEISNKIIDAETNDIGWKSDLSKYFDSVPIEYIDKVFINMEKKIGQSKIIDIVRKYYHSNYCFDINGNLIEKYMSLRQGVATASFLACAVLYDIDKRLSEIPGIVYYRYSDDMICLGKNYPEAMKILTSMLSDMSLTLNPKKLETIYKDKWFKFLGFNIKGSQITISKSRVKTFQKEIENRTIRQKKATPKSALNQVNNFLYKGDGTYSWATSILPIINVQKDINILNSFVMDCLRAVETKKTRLGGIGSTTNNDDYTLMRGTGRNVKANKAKTAKIIPGYMTLNCARNALLTSRDAYDTLVRQL